MITETTQTTDVVKFEEISSVILTAPEAYEKNLKLYEKAVDKARSLQDTIEGQGMNDELDSELNDWMAKAKQADTLFKNRRSPITQMANQVIKLFTSLEAPFDGTKKDSFYSTFQIYRNGWAKQKAEVQRQKEAEILRKQNYEKEVISLTSDIEMQVRTAYAEKLFQWKNYANGLLSSMTLENFKEKKAAIEAIKIDYPQDKFIELPVNISSIHVDSVERERLILTGKMKLYTELAANYRENMEDIRQQLIDKIPSKKRELENIAKAGEEQRKLLEEQAAQRKADEEAKLRAEQEAQLKADEDKIKLQQQMQTAGTLFDTAAQLSEVKANTGKVREGYKITVTDPAGWGAIFLFWFEKEGQFMSADDIEKKTMKQLKAFAEKFAHKNNEKIENDAVVYEEEYKAVVTKS